MYAGDTADAVTLNIDRAGATDEILIRRSDSDPDATVLQLKDNNRSGYLPVFAFDIDTDDSKNDIEIRQLPIQLTVSSGTLNTFVRDVRIVIDGKTYTDETTTNGKTGTVTFKFDNDELMIDAGDRVTAIVEVDFRALDNTYEGTTITGNISASTIVAEGKDDLSGSQLAGQATGEAHSLATKGTSASNNKATAVVTSVSGSNNDYATFSITATLRAFGQDVYIPIGSTGVTYRLTDAIGNGLNSSGTAVVSSSADETGSYFRISEGEGESETITLDVTYLPGTPNVVARLQLVRINFSDEPEPPTQSWAAQPANNYRTPVVTIVN